MYEERIHITPDTYIHALREHDCQDYLFLAPEGERRCNEMSDVHYRKDAFVPYHEHSKGVETFSIDRGRVEVTINGKRCVAEEGDLIHIPPYTSHGFRFLEEGTIWRELFQDMDMYTGIMEKNLIRRSCPEFLEDPDFMASYRLRHHTVRLGEPEPEDVDKSQVPQIRPKGGALTRVVFDGVVCSQKVGRWETGGEKEIWEFAQDRDMVLEWAEPHPSRDLFVVKSGRVEVQAAGETFTAQARDILNIPPYTPHAVTVLEPGTVLHAYNCRSLVLRWMEELELMGRDHPDKLKDKEAVREVLRRHGCYLTGFERRSAGPRS